MKYALLILGIAASLTCSAQNGTTIESLEDNVLYRGYMNKITIVVDRNEDRIVQLNGRNVVILAGNEPYTYNVKPANGKTATLNAVAVEGDHADTIYSKVYEVRNLPVPTLYWGDVKSGGTPNFSVNKLSMRYPDGVSLPTDFTIVGWEISVEDVSVSGNGDDMSSAKVFLESVKSGTEIEITVKVLIPDGVMRTVRGLWKV